MDYPIYQILYNLGDFNLLEAVIAASSEDDSHSFLEEWLSNEVYQPERFIEMGGLDIEKTTDSGFISNRRGLISPFFTLP